jgi:hypothetical protein
MITWIYDPKGQNGKSYLARKLSRDNPNVHLSISSLSNQRDIAEVVKSAIQTGWKGKVVHINLTRSSENQDYDTLEQLSDGIMTSLKYNGSTLRFGRGYRIVYSNNLPNIKGLSLDRWDIRQLIGSGEKAELVRLNVYDLIKKSTRKYTN